MQLFDQLPVTVLLFAFILLTSCGAWLLFRGLRHYRKLHITRGSCQCSIGGLLFALGLILITVLINIASYGRLTHEQQVANLYFTELAPQQYRASVNFANENRLQEFEISGDEWQLDAKVLKWHSYANLLGLDAQYKLHRLSGRYQTLEQARQTPTSVYELHTEPGIDLWKYARRYPNWLPLVDAYYGSAVFLPMTDNAQYEVFMTQSGLIARPVEIPESSLKRW